MGGGAIRAAAKAAASRSPAIFGSPTVHRFPWAKNSEKSGPSKAEVGLSALTLDEARTENVRQRPVFELDDWEFAGWEGEGRIVFGPVPTFDEAKAATFDLKEAVERAHVTQTATANSAVNARQGSNVPEASAIIPQMPTHVVQAFSFLQGSPEAQDVVASLASDIKIWNAVMNNEKVVEFFKKHQTASTPVDSKVGTGKCHNCLSAENDIESSASSSIEDFYQSFKIKVEEVVNNISIFFKEILASSPGLSASACAKSLQSNIVSYTEPPVGVGASLFALAVATILVVLFKRAD